MTTLFASNGRASGNTGRVEFRLCWTFYNGTVMIPININYNQLHLKLSSSSDRTLTRNWYDSKAIKQLPVALQRARNCTSEDLNFKISRGSMPPDPLQPGSRVRRSSSLTPHFKILDSPRNFQRLQPWNRLHIHHTVLWLFAILSWSRELIETGTAVCRVFSHRR